MILPPFSTREGCKATLSQEIVGSRTHRSIGRRGFARSRHVASAMSVVGSGFCGVLPGSAPVDAVFGVGSPTEIGSGTGSMAAAALTGCALRQFSRQNGLKV